VNCVSCVNLVIGSTSKPDLNMAMLFDTPPLGDTSLVKPLLDRGADLNTKDPDGNTLLTMVCAADTASPELVKFLIDHGADVNARSPHGETALELSVRHGHTPVVDLLMRAGAKPSEGPARQSAELPADTVETKTAPAHTARAAVDRSLPLLQGNDVQFMRKSGCVSCHNNTLTAMTVAAARQSGIAVDDRIAGEQLRATATYLEGWRDRALQGIGIPGDADSMSAILVGMADAKYLPDPATGAVALFLKNHQSPDGRWYSTAYRPPMESSDVQTTAVSLRAVQVYAPQPQRADYDRAVQRAAAWLANDLPRTTEDRAYQLLGLAWAGADQKTINQAASGLLAEQRPDGGWSQIPSLSSDAFATGQALVALAQSGAVAVTDAAYQRGAQYLMGTQLADGSWYVKRRALPIQPYFESGFPHGRDQFISAAATNWATTALALATRTSTSAIAKVERR
jgi:hypothetical protein